jgi:hypothetical protein
MAKDQNLALNPGKLSGICGRLKCCLAYEHCLYADLKRALPKVGSHVATSRGAGVIRGQNILEQSVLVNLETGGQVTLKVSEVSVRPRLEAAGRAQGAGQTVSRQAGETPPAGKPAPRESERGRGRRPRRQGSPQGAEPANGEEIPRDLAALEDP